MRNGENESRKMWAVLLHLGSNMWGKPGDCNPCPLEEEMAYHETLYCDKDTWKKVTEYLPQHGINTVVIDPKQDNSVVKIEDIKQTVIYDKDNRQLVKLDGYLDIGLHDTMKDLLVNFIGAIIFSIYGYMYIINQEKFETKHVFKIFKMEKLAKLAEKLGFKIVGFYQNYDVNKMACKKSKNIQMVISLK